MTIEEPRMSSRKCTIAITIDEAGDQTRAIARMHWHDRNLAGVGSTRPSEIFPDRLSETLSVSRALSGLVAQLDTDHASSFAALVSQPTPTP
jgi:Domain of unknown function (DUF1876)